MPRRIINDIIAGRGAVTAAPDVTVRAASRMMVENRIGAMLVMQGSRIAGIFTERDALNKVLAGGLDPDATTLGAVMVADPQTITGDRPLAHALHMMVEAVSVTYRWSTPEEMKAAKKGEKFHTEEEALKLAQEAKARIDKGEDFAKVAKDMTEDTATKEPPAGMAAAACFNVR